MGLNACVINDIIDYDASKNRFVIYQWRYTNKENMGIFDFKNQQL